jgi:cobalt-zinc-cadmium efflux system outer membrane protein
MLPRSLVLAALGLAGCATSRPAPVPTTAPPPVAAPAIQQASHAEPVPATLGLPELTALTLDRHPRLAQVAWAVAAARGRAVQAGLYPNPVVSVVGDELGDVQGPGGIWTAPQLTQEIVTANKLGLAKAVADREVDRATLAVVSERFRLLTDVRQAYWEVVALRRRADVLAELIALADQSVSNAERLLKAKEASELDVVQLEVDRERYRAERDATERALPAAAARLAAAAGSPDLAAAAIAGDLEAPLPGYDLDHLQAYVRAVHPDAQAAQVGVERAKLAVRRAEVEPIPNVTLTTGYVRQNQNRSHDWTFGASVPVPVWNKNQGNVAAARAELGEAQNEVGRVQLDLSGRVARAFATYAAARARAEKYKAAILPKAERSLDLTRKAYQGKEFEYLRVLQAQRAVAEARLEYVRSLGEVWQAAAELAGLTLDDQWPAARKQP